MEFCGLFYNFVTHKDVMKARFTHISTLLFVVIIGLLQCCFHAKANNIMRQDDALLSRVFAYSKSVEGEKIAQHTSYSYTKYSLFVRKRNFLLLAVPTMWAVAHGEKRHYLGESYERVVYTQDGKPEIQRLTSRTTIPSSRGSLTTVLKYLTPDVYQTTIFKDGILSPFYEKNRSYYNYQVTLLPNGKAQVKFQPRVNNTRLVSGEALINFSDGRIISLKMSGEYDMVNFTLSIVMGQSGAESLLPNDVDLSCQFRFLGNITDGRFRSIYNLRGILPDSVVENDRNSLALVRPIPLTTEEKMLYDKEQETREHIDSIRKEYPKKKGNAWKTVFWDVIGNNVINQIKSNFGKNNEGYLRINPILNPLYMGYDHKRGFTYKFDVRLNYMFTSNTLLTTRIRSGYSFKQKQLYFSLPIMYWYDRRHNGYIEIEVGNGNWITNGNAVNYARNQIGDSVVNKYSRSDFFKDSYVRLLNNYDFNSQWGFQAGMILHHRKAVEGDVYRQAGMPTQYTSVAPLLEIQWRPIGWQGPYIALDYERGIKRLLKGNIGYERWELDAQWKLKLRQLKSLQMRLGFGGYTLQSGHTFFLDYTNFRENHVPGGWNDDWSGEFELLNSNKYNESRWYARGNITYESPLLTISHLPWVGHFIEMERIYASVLSSRNCHPYIEIGYGFTTRLFSMGMFLSNDSGKIKEFGCKFGFELFRHW